MSLLAFCNSWIILWLETRSQYSFIHFVLNFHQINSTYCQAIHIKRCLYEYARFLASYYYIVYPSRLYLLTIFQTFVVIVFCYHSNIQDLFLLSPLNLNLFSFRHILLSIEYFITKMRTEFKIIAIKLLLKFDVVVLQRNFTTSSPVKN